VAAYNISFGCNFFGTKSYDMGRVDWGRMIEETTINKKNRYHGYGT